MPPIANIKFTKINGFIAGKSIYIIFCNVVAPSISAASYSSGGMPESTAVYNIEAHPIPCQIPEKIYRGLKVSVLVKKLGALIPNESRIETIGPVDEKNR